MVFCMLLHFHLIIVLFCFISDLLDSHMYDQLFLASYKEDWLPNLFTQQLKMSQHLVYNDCWAFHFHFISVFPISFSTILIKMHSLQGSFNKYNVDFLSTTAVHVYLHIHVQVCVVSSTVDWKIFLAGNFCVLGFGALYFYHQAKWQNFFAVYTNVHVIRT